MTPGARRCEVLWVTAIAPGRGGGGGHIRQAHLIGALAERAQVHLISSEQVSDPVVRNAVASLVEVAVRSHVLPRWARRVRDLWRGMFGRQPAEVADLVRTRRALAPFLTTSTADVIILECSGLADLVVSQRQVPAKWILSLHNVGSVMALHQSSVQTASRKRWLYRRDAEKWTRWLAGILPRFDGVVTVSDLDASSLPALERSVAVIPNGVDVDRFRLSPLPAGPRLVFTGALYTGPNRDGLTWFCTAVLPLIRDSYPDTTLAIVGMDPPPEVMELSSLDGVEVRANVVDVFPFIGAARVAVVPLRIGSGTRLKVLEAMAAGRVVVTTSIGMEGLAVEPGRHALVADDPAAFAAAVCRAVADDDLVHSMIEEARELVERRYAWPAIQQQFVEAAIRESE